MSIKRKLFSNTISNGLQFGSRWSMNLLFAKSLTTSSFGIFSFIYTIAVMLGTFFAFGSNLYLLKQVSEDKCKRMIYLFESFLITTLFFIVSVVLSLLAFKYFLTDSPYSYTIQYGLFLAFVLAINMNIFSFFKGQGDFEKEAKIYIIFSFILLLIVGMAFYLDLLSRLSLQVIFITLISINLLPSFLGIKYLYIQHELSIHQMKQMFSMAFYNVFATLTQRLAYGLHESQSILYANLPFILLGILTTVENLGHYRAIYLLITPFLILPGIIAQVLLSQLANNKSDMIGFKKIFRKFSLFSFLIGTIFIGLYWEFGAYFIEMIYGMKFEREASLTLIHIFIITSFFWFIKSNYEVLLTVMDKQWLRVNVLWIMLMLYPVLVFILPLDITIYKYAYAALITTIIMLATYIIQAELILKRTVLTRGFNDEI